MKTNLKAKSEWFKCPKCKNVSVYADWKVFVVEKTWANKEIAHSTCPKCKKSFPDTKIKQVKGV